MKLNPESLTVDSFDLTQDVSPFYVIGEPSEDVGIRSRYCSLYDTCNTCRFTDCPCA
ncbi:MAG TPA: hypothetical protein VGC13_10960 [Longimicrobium sp.]|jgi:hypothetical protein|uniref:hypothetical protein n=1 Tax=Longimicrobium sp. TaxID=2029185 RepID=UPI002EDB5136